MRRLDSNLAIDLPASGAVAVLPKDAPVAVSSPYLEAAVREVLCRDVPMVRLAGPSMCPGHFDMRPSQISELARCGLLVRFDFQQALDEKLARPIRAKRQPSACMAVCASRTRTFRHVAKWQTISCVRTS